MAIDNTALVRHFIRNWQQVARPRGNDQAFYEVLREFDAAALAPDGESMIGLFGDSDEDEKLLKLWQAWSMFFAGQEAPAQKLFKSVAKSLPKRPEPWIFLSCSAIIQGDKRTAHNAATRARKLAPDIEPISHLLTKFGVRNKPVIPFLHRDNPLNISLGKYRHRRQLKKTNKL